jgi:hypothetical protein
MLALFPRLAAFDLPPRRVADDLCVVMPRSFGCGAPVLRHSASSEWP